VFSNYPEKISLFYILKFNHQKLGSWGEWVALRYLKRNNFILWTKNWRIPTVGEIDIIGRIGRSLMFVEVKTKVYHPDFNAYCNYTTKQRNIQTIITNRFRCEYELRIARERIKYYQLNLITIEVLSNFTYSIISYEDV
jgi:Holliday junction resolvase-like predicted endonuclease